MAYATVANVRLISGLAIANISDADVTSLIAFATAKINADINYVVNDERVEYIDAEKENKMDGSNTTFYVKDTHKSKFQLGDYDNDGDVDKDDFYVYTLDTSTSPATRATETVSTIDRALGKFVLSSAPSTTENLYVTYSVAPLDENTPNTLLTEACAQLVAALAFTNINAKKLQGFTIGKIKVTKQSDGFNMMYKQYEDTMYRINMKINRFEENVNHI